MFVFLRVLPFLHISYPEFSYKKAHSMCKSSECFIDEKPDQILFFITFESMQYVIMHIIHLHFGRTKLRLLAGYSDQFQSGLMLERGSQSDLVQLICRGFFWIEYH